MGNWLWSSKPESSDIAKGSNREEEVAEISSYSRGQKILLEDTKPRFNTEAPSLNELSRQKEHSNFKLAVDSISKKDFSFSNLVMIPCFRDAGMLGFSSLFVIGSAMFLYHKNITKATNWALGSFVLGSIVGWEQCRNTRRRSFQNSERAKQLVQQKQKPMLHEVQHAEELKKQWAETTAEHAKKWYKFW
ncbi:hypothetical protein TPHA_0L01130 [Tetrapisispora phaffii CBS 4417]|uniref:Cytochrome c oxidase assembly protein COX20, mitochondrial n=1 Tax=Tetrapisispora phaffii (strain ATCC 24235 / CBS 4417 / NBRC 1672 / NRRL Y-8282 / UCD 70-5) TaxID=1071381 RepID=G8BZZ2_TETPH|nr:hypothetical protein TPHA_0L01130 [Tetrapisispora phaffii CBS 4417]CCE65470.1 hypothetical protein TPHA_0L01130 [Tetrapisispora phaffii CBS 4417]